MAKVSLPKGTRDFSPTEMARRNYIFDTIRSVYERHGYMPIETPAMERNDTLMGKYGEEGDRLIFRILNSGDFLSKADQEALGEGNSLRTANSITEKALRYDLTVPFARYVVQHQNDITFPFKRYQIQPVWRADRPQKGRYREFYQCDADVIGSKSLFNELELILIIQEVFAILDLKIEIKINDRRVLQGLAQLMGIEDRMVEYITILDKYDKIGKEGVLKELILRKFDIIVVNRTDRLISNLESSKGTNKPHEDLTKEFENAGVDSGFIGMKSIGEIMKMLKLLFDVKNYSENDIVTHDLALARGLNYYTGMIIEVLPKQGSIKSSICGGGRYDDLTGIFGLPNMSGVGISFGADRIYDILLELEKFPNSTQASTKLLFANFGSNEASESLKWLRSVRKAGINAELYPDNTKMGKQMKYADAKSIPWVAMMGSDEIEKGVASLKNMITGEQMDVDLETLINTIA